MKFSSSFRRWILALGASLGAPYLWRRWARVILGLVWLLIVTAIAFGVTVISERIRDPKVLWATIFASSLGSIAAGLFGAVATVLSLEVLRARRVEREERATFLSRLRSRDRGTVSAAIEELRSRRLLDSGYLDGADLRGVVFAETDLRGMRAVAARFDGADLTNAVLYGADIRFASLRDVTLSGATNLRLCKWHGADLTGVDGSLLRECGLPHVAQIQVSR